MHKLLEMQKMFMTFLGLETSAIDPNSRVFRDVVLGLASEVGEVAQEVNTGTRPWAEQNTDNLKEEMVDILFYLMEGFIFLGMDADDVTKAYRKKLAKNLARLVAKHPGIKLGLERFDDDGNVNHIPQGVRRQFIAGRYANEEVFFQRLQQLKGN